MWEISEADTNYFVLSTSVIKRSRKHCSSQHYSLKVSALFIFALFIYIYTHTHTLSLYKHFRARINFVEILGK